MNNQSTSTNHAVQMFLRVLVFATGVMLCATVVFYRGVLGVERPGSVGSRESGLIARSIQQVPRERGRGPTIHTDHSRGNYLVTK